MNLDTVSTEKQLFRRTFNERFLIINVPHQFTTGWKIYENKPLAGKKLRKTVIKHPKRYTKSIILLFHIEKTNTSAMRKKSAPIYAQMFFFFSYAVDVFS